ncbi:MAG: hypothetical protein RIT27_1035 [Pseudomonadota bacterium]|jgi:CheY-like chemotaxis protein
MSVVNSEPATPRAATILIVDDLETNLNILYVLVHSLGHLPVLAKNGKEALAALQKHRPDLILLDILMPDMNGYEVLATIRQSTQFRRLPIVVISAISEMDSIVKCIQLGADDYLTKPLNKILLEARIQNCLERKYWNDKESHYLRKINNRRAALEKMIIDKNKELAATYQALNNLNKTKNEFLRILSHELRTPLNSLLAPSRYLIDEQSDQVLRKESVELFTDALEQFKELIEHAELIVQLSLREKTHPSHYVHLGTVLDIAIHHVQKFADFRQIKLPKLLPFDQLILGDENLFSRGFETLLKLAIKFSTAHSTINICCESTQKHLEISISATGWLIPEKYRHTFFDLFGVTETIIPGGDLGLAPPLIARLFQTFDGAITFQNTNSTGVCFTVTLPIVYKSIDDPHVF